MREFILKKKGYAFAIRIVNMYKHITESQKENVLSKQVLRSGTAIGALIHEAERAESDADFVHKLNIALKEANETSYWLNLLHDTHYINDSMLKSMAKDCDELLKMLTSSINSVKSKSKTESRRHKA